MKRVCTFCAIARSILDIDNVQQIGAGTVDIAARSILMTTIEAILETSPRR
jgi:hypothetical protein